MRLYELGASGEVADIEVQYVKCSPKSNHADSDVGGEKKKNRSRRMSDAFGDEAKLELAHCRGRWPHMRKFDEEECKVQQRTILLGASNSWFPVMLSALSIPGTPDKLGQFVEEWTASSTCPR